MHGIFIARNAPVISNLFFADDCYIFCRASPTDCLSLHNIIDSFTKASGQTVNYSKSTLTFSKNTHVECRRAVCGILNMREGSMSGNYLGLPSLIGRNKKEILGFIKEKVVGRIKSWTNKFLSRAEKENSS